MSAGIEQCKKIQGSEKNLYSQRVFKFLKPKTTAASMGSKSTQFEIIQTQLFFCLAWEVLTA